MEQVRTHARSLRRDDSAHTADLAGVLDDVDLVEAIRLVRAFTVYFHLANTAEQVHRVDDLRDSAPASGNRFVDTVAKLQAAGISDSEIAAAVRSVELQPVFTAHPTEASRRSILDKLGEIAVLIEQRTETAADPARRRRIDRRIDELIDAIWQTDELRQDRPDPVDEARSILYYLTQMVSDGVPELLDDVDATLRSIGAPPADHRVPIRFGSWVGGDRDGNPNVTPAITAEVLAFQRSRALRLLTTEIEDLSAELSVSTAVVGISDDLAATVERDARAFPAASDRARALSPGEPYRQRITVMHQRLLDTAEHTARTCGLRRARRAGGRPGPDGPFAGGQRRGAAGPRSAGPGPPDGGAHRVPARHPRHPGARRAPPREPVRPLRAAGDRLRRPRSPGQDRAAGRRARQPAPARPTGWSGPAPPHPATPTTARRRRWR